MPPQGLSSEDLRQRALVGTLKRGDNGHGETDPIAQALSMKRQIVAGKIMDQAVTETDAETIRAENERLKAEIEHEQLQETRESKGKTDQWQEYIFAQMKTLQDQLAETQRALNQQQTEALQERLSLLTNEIERMQEERRQGPVNPVTTATETIQQARALLETIGPTPGTPPPVSGEDPTLVAWQLRAKLDHERWLAERADRHEERVEELRERARIDQQRLEMERTHLEKQDRFFTETAPKLVEVFAPLVQRIVGAQGAAAAAPVTAMPSLAAGVKAEKCACGNVMFFRQEQGLVICQRCGAEYQLGDAPSAQEGPAEDGGSIA